MYWCLQKTMNMEVITTIFDKTFTVQKREDIMETTYFSDLFKFLSMLLIMFLIALLIVYIIDKRRKK